MKLLTYWLLLGSLLLGGPVAAQTDTTATQVPEQWLLKAAPAAVPTTTPVVFDRCFPSEPELVSVGGFQGIVTAIQQRVVYPADVTRVDVEGRVFVSFTVTPAGEVRKIEVTKPLWPSYDSAAVNAVRQLPRFKQWPETYGDMHFTAPITFQVGYDQSASRRARRKAVHHRNSTP